MLDCRPNFWCICSLRNYFQEVVYNISLPTLSGGKPPPKSKDRSSRTTGNLSLSACGLGAACASPACPFPIARGSDRRAPRPAAKPCDVRPLARVDELAFVGKS